MKINKLVAHRFGVAALAVVTVFGLATCAKNPVSGNLKYEFTVVDSQKINAVTLPGGYIYVTCGILAYLNFDAEVAGVLGHEIGHVTARHGVVDKRYALETNYRSRFGPGIGRTFI